MSYPAKITRADRQSGDRVRVIPSTDHPNLEIVYVERNGVPHTDDDSPAVVVRDRTTHLPVLERWYRRGKAHRDGDLPAIVLTHPETGAVVKAAGMQRGTLWRAAGRPVVQDWLVAKPVP